jgi:hypothetical protein
MLTFRIFSHCLASHCLYSVCEFLKLFICTFRHLKLNGAINRVVQHILHFHFALQIRERNRNVVTYLACEGAQPYTRNVEIRQGICLKCAYVKSGFISSETFLGSFPTCMPNGYPRIEKLAYSVFAPPRKLQEMPT